MWGVQHSPRASVRQISSKMHKIQMQLLWSFHHKCLYSQHRRSVEMSPAGNLCSSGTFLSNYERRYIGFFPPSIYRVSQEECARLREFVPYVKVYRYNPKHLCPKLNGDGDNGQRKECSSGGSTHCTCQLTVLSMSVLQCGVILRQTANVLPSEW
jgi:hypothetical protein